MHAHPKDGQVEQEADAVDANTQDGFQLAHNRAGVFQSQGQVLAAFVHGDDGVTHVLQAATASDAPRDEL